MPHSTQFHDEYCTLQDNLYGMYCPMDVKQDLSYWDPAGITLNEAEVRRSGVTSFTRPLLSDGALLGGRNWRRPTTRYTADTGQISGMSFCPNYYDQSETSAPPNADIERPMDIQNLHQSCFPSIHQAQPLISMQSSDPVDLSPNVFSFDGFEHTTDVSSSNPHQSTVFTQNPYGTPSSVQGGHSSRSTTIYESAPIVGFSGRGHYDLAPPTIFDMCTEGYDQDLPSFISSDFDGFEHTMGVSNSYPNQPTCFIQNPYHSYLQHSVGAPSSVQGGHSSGCTCIYESIPSMDISRGDQYNSGTGTNTNMNTVRSAQVQPSLIAPDADGCEHTMGVSTSYSNQPTVFIQDPYHALVQPSIGIASQVQVPMPSSGSACIYKSAPSIDTSREDQDDSIGESKRPECQLCHKTFRCVALLKRHSMVHTDERPFECGECDVKFARKDTLKAHYDRVHLAKKPFKCEMCARSFFVRRELDKHYCDIRCLI